MTFDMIIELTAVSITHSVLGKEFIFYMSADQIHIYWEREKVWVQDNDNR